MTHVISGYDAMIEMINNDKYKVKIEYPIREKSKNYHAEISAWRQEQARLDGLFRQDLFTEYDVSTNPKADLCFAKAWERGHYAGLTEVLLCFDDLVELIK